MCQNLNYWDSFLALSSSPAASSITWQWQYNTSVCFDDGENATLTWRVTLNSGEEIGAVSIRQQAVAGGPSVEMYSTASGKDPAFSNRVMSASYSGSSPVYDVVFTLKVNNSEDGFGTKSIQCRVTSKNFLIGQPASDTLLKVLVNKEVIVMQSSANVTDGRVPPSSVVISPPSPTVTERDQVNLTCSADGTPPPTFTWISPQGHTVAHGPFYTIPMVHRDMSGLYTCVATDGCGRNHTRDATLAVRYKPDNTSLTILGGNASAQCGSKISFNCTADGVPKPNKYSLYLGNQAIKTDTNGEFSNIQLNTSGEHVFTCVPTNKIDEGLNKTVIVNASEVLPVVSVDIPPNGRMVKGSSVTLTCDGTGPVPLQISWYKDNIFKASGKTLTISKVTVQDEGNYTCNVSSSCGTTLNTSFIGVDYIPENTTLQINKSNNTSIIACVGDIILLNCYAEGKPSVITYPLLLNGDQHKANRSGVFLVFPGTPGWNNFSCVPYNTIGKGPEALVHIIVPVTPSSVVIFPPSPTVTERDQVNLTCSADGTPPPTFTWIGPQGRTVAHGPSYTIPMVHRNMTGMVYTCVATNGCGKNLTKDAKLAVQYKPVNTSLTILGGDASRQCGSKISFNCTADGVRKPNKYSLYLGNQAIKTNTNGVLSNIKLNTSGEHVFICVPTNEIGEGVKKTVIVNASEVLPVVSVDIPPNGRMIKGSSVTLTCDAKGPVPLQISWYKDNIFKASGKNLTILKVTLQDEGNYTCNVSSSCGTTLNTLFIIVDYANMERYSLKCITSPAVSITIETNKTPPPDIVCMNDGKRLQSKITSTTETKVTYEVKLASLDEIEVDCNAEGFPGSQHKFTVVPAGSEQTSNESFRITNVQYPPSKQVKSNIEKLVRESIDTTCLKEIFLSYGSGSVLVYVSLVLTANIADPFVLLKDALVENAPRYGFAIEPVSVKIQLPESLPQLSDVMPASSSLKVTWSNATRNAQCTMRARPLAGASRDWVTSSGVSNSASLSCVLDDLEPDTLYEVEVTMSVRGDTRRDTVYIRTTQSAVELNDQNSTIVSLAVLVAILFLVIFGLIVYIAVLKTAGLTAKRERSEANNPGYSGFQNVAMQENVNKDQHVIPGVGDYEVAPSDNRGPTPDPIPQYEPVNNTPVRPPNRRNVTQYEDVTQGSNVTQYEDVTQEGNVTQYEAMNRHASRDRHVPGNRQYDCVGSTRMSRQNPPARRARNDTCDQGEPGYENTRKRGLPHEVYQSLQATTQHSENAHYASLHPGTRIAARPGGRDERGVGTHIRGSEYQELNRAKTTDPCYQRVGSRVTSA
ncbi:hemicentin-1 [Nematostella vectensis]|uniref:hemicentin-1 n=1 Tax=Nematostella vectensis TaxID=45351 RepID=UPI002076F9BB|nr:hemicentin-1 [Nematostella vectensis]